MKQVLSLSDIQSNTRRRMETCSSLAQSDFAEKPAASAASLDYVKFQAVIKSASSAASLDYIKFRVFDYCMSAASAACPGRLR